MPMKRGTNENLIIIFLMSADLSWLVISLFASMFKCFYSETDQKAVIRVSIIIILDVKL